MQLGAYKKLRDKALQHRCALRESTELQRNLANTAVFPPIMMTIELLEAKGKDLQRIENMMQFYMYDFSEWLPLPFNEDGWFSIRSKAEYWAKSSTKPFLIAVDGETAGFLTVDDEVTHRDADFSIGYFFVGRRFRGAGVGKAAVAQILQLFPGCWQIFHVKQNASASAFWKKVVPIATGGKFTVHRETIDDYECTLYKFHSG